MKLKNIIFLFVVMTFAGGCSMFKTIEYKTSDGIALEKLEFDTVYDRENKKIYLSGPGGTFVMNLNRRIALFNGTKIWFYSPVRLDADEVLRIGETDVEKIIKPLLEPKNILPAKIKRIVVDAGHGGNDSGAVGKKCKEKDLNLSLSRKIKTALEAKGFEVIMTRNEDKFLTLDERSKFAADQKADLFLCIHHNASGASRSAYGIETYSLSAPHAASTHDGKKITPAGELPGNKFDAANVNLSYQVQSYLINRIKTNDRGMKFARFRVLVKAPCPAILLEAGFVSNPEEEAASDTDDRQNTAAEAVANAVAAFAASSKLQ